MLFIPDLWTHSWFLENHIVIKTYKFQTHSTRNQLQLSLTNNRCLQCVSWQSVQQLLRHFSLYQSGGQTGIHVLTAMPLAWLKRRKMWWVFILLIGVPDWKACTNIFSSSDLFCLEIWGGVRGLNATKETLASCTRCSTVPVSSCACLRISVMKQVTLSSPAASVR